MNFEKEYEKFTGGPNVPNNERIHVTINKMGVIYLNRNCHRMLGQPAAVHLFFNRIKDRIAIKKVQPLLADAFPLKEKPGYYLIHASPFCRNYGIRLDTTEKFVRPDIDSDGILYLDLTNTLSVTKIRPDRKKK